MYSHKGVQMIELKKCTKCKQQKEVINFRKSKAGKNGLYPQCKDCVKQYESGKMKEYNKQYRLDNKDKMKEYKKEYRKNNSEYLRNKSKITRETKSYKESVKEFRAKNKDHIVEYNKQYYENNRVEILKNRKQRNQTDYAKSYRNQYKKERRQSDICYKLTGNIQGRIKQSLKRNLKSKNTIELIGCTIEELKLHIENQFKDGMTWENYGFYTWHIDHIRPCASFDLSDPEQQKICFNYKNMQPLWAHENLSKHAKYN